jgi:hypothetical protein
MLELPAFPCAIPTEQMEVIKFDVIYHARQEFGVMIARDRDDWNTGISQFNNSSLERAIRLEISILSVCDIPCQDYCVHITFDGIPNDFLLPD